MSLKNFMSYEDAATVLGEYADKVNELKSGLTNYQAQNDLNLEVPKRKNVLPFPYGNTTITKNGVTFTVNSDNTVTVSGTATDDAEFVLANASTHTTFYLDNGNYVFNGCPVGGSTSTYYQAIFKNGQAIGYDGGNGVELNNIVTTDSIGCGIWVKSGTVISTPITFSPMIRPKGTSDVYSKFIPSVESRIEAVESNQPVTVISVTADGVKTYAEILESMRPYSTLNCTLTVDNDVYQQMGVKKFANISITSNSGNIRITTMQMASNANKAFQTEIKSDGTSTVAEITQTVPTSGMVFSLIKYF